MLDYFIITSNGRGCAFVRAEGIWDISVASSRFCVNLKLLLKNSFKKQCLYVNEVLMMYRWWLNGSRHPLWFLHMHVLQPRKVWSVQLSAVTWWERIWQLNTEPSLCSQRRTRSGRPCLLWINLAGTPKGMLSTFMNFWRKWPASLNPRYFLIEVESLWPTWREKPLSTKAVTLNAFRITICQPPCLPLLLK